MILAIATDNGAVAAHFGRCQEYVLIELSDQWAKNRKVVPNPGHEPGMLPAYLARLGVNCVVAGGMGARARDLFAKQGIEVIIGLSCAVDEAVELYRTGRVEEGAANLCGHGHNMHSCEGE